MFAAVSVVALLGLVESTSTLQNIWTLARLASDDSFAAKRGALNMLFQLATTVGIFCANLVNYGTQNIQIWGWCLSLGLAAVPYSIMFIGGLFLSKTPNSLIECGHLEKGKQVLKKIYGTQNIQAKFDDLIEATKVAQSLNHSFQLMGLSRMMILLMMSMLFELHLYLL